MIVWIDSVENNDRRCIKCGLKYIEENGEVSGVIILRNKKGYCKNCGAHVCDDKIVKPEGGKEKHERK